SRDRVLKPVRISDRDNQLAYSNFLRVSQMRGNKIGRIDSDNSQICIGVVSDQLCGILIAVRSGDVDTLHRANYVAVSQDETVWSDYDPRPASASLTRISRRVAPFGARPVNFNVYD